MTCAHTTVFSSVPLVVIIKRNKEYNEEDQKVKFPWLIKFSDY